MSFFTPEHLDKCRGRSLQLFLSVTYPVVSDPLSISSSSCLFSLLSPPVSSAALRDVLSVCLSLSPAFQPLHLMRWCNAPGSWQESVSWCLGLWEASGREVGKGSGSGTNQPYPRGLWRMVSANNNTINHQGNDLWGKPHNGRKRMHLITSK